MTNLACTRFKSYLPNFIKEIDYLSVSNKENQLLHKETIKPDMLRLLKFNSPRSKREEWTLSSKYTSCLEFI